MSYYKRRHRKVNATLIVCYIESILTFTQVSNSTAVLKTESIIYRKKMLSTVIFKCLLAVNIV